MSNSSHPFHSQKFYDHLNKRDPNLVQNFEQMIQDKLFQKQQYNSIEQYKELTFQRFKKLSEHNLFSVQDVVKNPKKVFQCLELLAYIDSSLALKAHTNYVLFGGAMQLLGNPKKLKSITQQMDNMDVIGCFALSEKGSGNNYSSIETQCKYKESTNTLVLNTPKDTAAKVWVGNCKNDANYCLVYSRLFINKKFEGIHPFLVKLRETNGQICPTIKIKEMPSRFGFKGLEFAQIEFQNHEISPNKLISSIAKIQNNKLQTIGEKQAYDHYYQIFPYARFSISAQLLGRTKYAFLIALRYASYRKILGSDGQSSELLMNTQMFQSEVFPLLASTVCLNLAYNESSEIFSYLIKTKTKIGISLSQVNLILKVLISQNARQSGTILMERLGGQAFLEINKIQDLIEQGIGGISAEGDNALLMQKVAREQFIAYSLKKISLPVLGTSVNNLLKIDHFNVSESLIDLLKLREIMVVQKLQKKTKEETKYGSSTLYWLWSKQLQGLVQQAAQAYAQRIVAELCYLSIMKADEEIKDYLKAYLKLFIISAVLKNLGWYQIHKKINKNAVRGLYRDHKYYTNQIANFALNTAEAFEIPESLVQSPIAQDYEQYYSRKEIKNENLYNYVPNNEPELSIQDIKPKL